MKLKLRVSNKMRLLRIARNDVITRSVATTQSRSCWLYTRIVILLDPLYNSKLKTQNSKLPSSFLCGESGQYFPIFAIVIGLVILPAAGIIMDGAYLYMQKAQLQVMADNAAKSGVFELVKMVTDGAQNAACTAALDCDLVNKEACSCYDGETCGIARIERNQKAKNASKDYATRNGFRNATDFFDADAGCYGTVGGTNYASFATAACNGNFASEDSDADRVINSAQGYDAADQTIDGTGNAIRVTLSRPVNHFFAKLLGITSTQVRVTAIARLAPTADLPNLAPFGLLQSAFDELGENNTFWDSNNNSCVNPGGCASGYKGLLNLDWRYDGDNDGGDLICDDDDYTYTGPFSGDTNDGDLCAAGNPPDGHSGVAHVDAEEDDTVESEARSALGGRDPSSDSVTLSCACTAASYTGTINPVLKDSNYGNGITNDGTDYNAGTSDSNIMTYITSGYPEVPSGYEVQTGQRVDVRTGVVADTVRDSVNTHSCTVGNVFAMPLVDYYQGQGTGADWLITGYAVLSVVDEVPGSCDLVSGSGNIDVAATTMNAILPGEPGVAFNLNGSNGCGNWSYTLPDGTVISAGAYTIVLVE